MTGTQAICELQCKAPRFVGWSKIVAAVEIAVSAWHGRGTPALGVVNVSP